MRRVYFAHFAILLRNWRLLAVCNKHENQKNVNLGNYIISKLEKRFLVIRDFTGLNRFLIFSAKQVKFVDDTELAYVMQRYREVHDFVHTLAGLSIRFERTLKTNRKVLRETVGFVL